MGATGALLFPQVFNASRRLKLRDVSDERPLASSGSTEGIPFPTVFI